jgi:glyoxylate reductase
MEMFLLPTGIGISCFTNEPVIYGGMSAVSKKKILVTYPLPEEGLQCLANDFEVTIHREGSMSRESLLPIIADYDGILAAGIHMDAGLIRAADRLRIISVYGAGFDAIDIQAATEKGIVVANIPDAVTDATAEVAMGLMLSVMRRISECDRALRHGDASRWGMMKNMGHVLYGKELGIIGMGRIGRAVAKRASAFAMPVSYYNRKRLDPVIEMELGAVYKRLDDLLKSSDVITIHTPLTQETHHLIGERELSLMKPTAYLINTSRGPVVEEKALAAKLQQGRLAGAGLDVYEREPVISPELLKMDNVVLTPHIGTDTIETRIHMAWECARNILNFFNGRPPFHVVNSGICQSK